MASIEIECPVKGTWSFLNPPGHHPDAKDLVAVDAVVIETESSCDDRVSLNLVRDVVAGLVLAKRHAVNDARFFLGNHVVMQSDAGIYALFAHLRKESIRVEKGERVGTGDWIAAVGNSGNTIQPHLHFQLMKDNSPFSSPPLRFVFASYETRQGKAWKTERTFLPKDGQVFRAHGAG